MGRAEWMIVLRKPVSERQFWVNRFHTKARKWSLARFYRRQEDKLISEALDELSDQDAEENFITLPNGFVAKELVDPSMKIVELAPTTVKTYMRKAPGGTRGGAPPAEGGSGSGPSNQAPNPPSGPVTAIGL